MCTGCLGVSILSTRHEQLSHRTLDTRVSRSVASVDGTQCYVDARVELTERLHVPLSYRLFALLEIVLPPIAGGFSKEPDAYYASAIVADGLATALYIHFRDNEIRSRASWEETTETGGCP